LEDINSIFQRYKYELGINDKFPIINTRVMNLKIGGKKKNIINDKNEKLELIAYLTEFKKNAKK
jgi:hypothetical protein